MWYTMRCEDVQKTLDSNLESGLNDKEVQCRREKYGENKLQDKKKESLLIRFFKQFNDFMIIILII